MCKHYRYLSYILFYLVWSVQGDRVEIKEVEMDMVSVTCLASLGLP